jgi:hypothetical protein
MDDCSLYLKSLAMHSGRDPDGNRKHIPIYLNFRRKECCNNWLFRQKNNSGLIIEYKDSKFAFFLFQAMSIKPKVVICPQLNRGRSQVIWCIIKIC